MFDAINVHLWNQAKWHSIGYDLHTGIPPLPTVALMFADPRAATRIFQEWRKTLGSKDDRELLRVAFIRKRHSYILHIGPSLPDFATTGPTEIATVSRFLELPDGGSLAQFRAAFEAEGRCYVAPGVNGGIFSTLTIEKQKILFRDIGDVTANDPDMVVLAQTDVS